MAVVYTAVHQSIVFSTIGFTNGPKWWRLVYPVDPAVKANILFRPLIEMFGKETAFLMLVFLGCSRV